MSRLLVRLVGVSAAVAFGLVLLAAHPAVLAGAVTDDASDGQELFDLAGDPELSARNRDLDTRLEQVAGRAALKEELTDRLLAGQVSLAAAADGFVDINSQWSGCLEVMRLHFPAASDRVSAALNVIEYAHQRAEPAVWPAAHCRLTAELRELVK